LEGYSQQHGAQFLGVQPRTVRRWIATSRQQGAQGLAAKPAPGRPPKLPRRKQGLVLGWLRKNPKSFGFPTELWTAQRVAQVIERKFGVHYHPRSINAWLTGGNFSPQKPQRRARERHDAASQAWLQRDWPRIKKKARRQRAHIILIDESGLLLAPLLRRTQAPRGHTPLFRHNAKHRQKVSVLAALTLSPLRCRLGLYFTSLVNDSFDAVAVAWFLRQLLRSVRGKVILIWDRGTMHKGPEIRQVLQDFPRLSLEWLPAYAPELNPVEQIWRHLKWGRLCNLAPDDSTHLENLVFAELDPLRKEQRQLETFFDASKLPRPKRALLT
jgi:transposase